ncbi:heavy metal-associated isoprenylated plant protein 14-like [Rutidosis leptorrhynchoides]|uniref:heavy metal-associated isoprenylated plant protein 14-like n=1 Tax=Rutidosis leptorrhynchoides TaxID=125765 RepID=UPI003A99B639
MAEPKKVIYEVSIHDLKGKRKVMKAFSRIKGVDSLDIDLNGQKLTVVGIFDEIQGYDKLAKVCDAKLEFVEIVKKEEPKKEEPKKEEAKKEDDKKENESYKPWSYYEPHFNPYLTERYCVIMEENPKCCVIS